MHTVEQLQLALTMDTLNKEHRSIIKDTYFDLVSVYIPSQIYRSALHGFILRR